MTTARSVLRLRVVVACVLLALAPLLFASSSRTGAEPSRPNILFVILDDVGIDQLELFGYGGAEPPRTPNLEAIAAGGILFSNAWSMPACSTSRSALFSGRFPLRTRVFGALGPSDLANSQLSPYEMTTPRLLAQAGYRSGLFGKFHLGLQSNNPYGIGMPAALGWDHYAGSLDQTGDPPSIDTTAGGVAPEGTWTCGFVPDAGVRSPANPSITGASTGACYAASGTCQGMSTAGGIPPGRACRDGGGIFDPGRACQPTAPAYLDFSRLNGHYVSPYAINRRNGATVSLPPTDRRARTFRGSQVVDDALDWIDSQPANRPWMASVSFTTAHAPLMQPPQTLLPTGALNGSDLDWTNVVAQRILMNQMIEALDTELGRLLASIGIGRLSGDGTLEYRPDASDTMVVILGDNGTFGGVVKPPFDPSRAKGSAYQTGVWVPLVVAGPLVSQPGRTVAHMVNIVDLYRLFGEIAGIDVPASVPRRIDAQPMMPYLVSASQASLREWNFTQVGPNLQAGGAINAPCTIGNSCTHIPVTQSVCLDNGGTWWGPGAPDPSTTDPRLPPGALPPAGLQQCCQTNVWITENTPTGQAPTRFAIEPLSAVAIRNEAYKVVRNTHQLNDDAYTRCEPLTSTDEFYAINQAVPRPRLDREGLDLLLLPELNEQQQASYEALSTRLDELLASEPECPGDGNLDGKVNGQDVAGWREFRRLARGASSWFDMNLDGRTEQVDLELIQENRRSRCNQDVLR